MSFLKRNSILLVFLVVYLATVALALIELDKQYYQAAKKDLITEAVGTYLGEPAEEAVGRLVDQVPHYFSALNPNLRDEILNTMRDVVDSDANPIYRISVRDLRETNQTQNLFDVENPRKLETHNTFANSLLLRDFSAKATKQTADPNLLIYCYYTTPRDSQVIAELTLRYRWYAVFIVLALTLLAVALARLLLIPLNKVLNALERSTAERIAFVHRPGSRLEMLYNRMALAAVTSRLQGMLREEITRNPQLTGWEIVEFICRSFREQADLSMVAGLELVDQGPGQRHATGRHVVAAARRLERQHDTLRELMIESVHDTAHLMEPIEIRGPSQPLVGEMQIATDPERPGVRYLFAVLMNGLDIEPGGQTPASMLDNLRELVEAGLQSLSLRNQLVVKERGRANINLSRNLGHDLTNIIATTKLELKAIERVIHRDPQAGGEIARTVLKESLEGLLKSVRFMQETVNLYRSYAFLQHPVMEAHDGNSLIEETLELFTLSTSARVEIRRELAGDAPRCVVDPRLIKLALFNMFSNSLKAIRRRDPEMDDARGWIRVSTQRTLQGGLRIVVEDSGTGITHPTGERMQPHEVDKIFELGYTNEASHENGSEGLGLNWVRTIIQDLHGGTIRAANSSEPDAGAVFTIDLPPIQRPAPPEASNAG